MSALAKVVNLHEKQYDNLQVKYNPIEHSVVFEMTPQGRPCFSEALLKELKQMQKFVCADGYRFIILASAVKGVFNLGGDLHVFRQFIENQDREGLIDYMQLCLSVLHPMELTDTDLHRIAVVQGAALGGGFEAALCCDYIIAEEQAMFGFPEILFNLFPGMGAYSYLIRRVTPSVAKRLITSGLTYTASELMDMGVIDLVVKEGEGHQAAREYTQRFVRRENGFRAINRLSGMVNNLEYRELLDIGKLWVNTALNLTPNDLKMMERLERRQHKYA